jgi:hypothetical protein
MPALRLSLLPLLAAVLLLVPAAAAQDGKGKDGADGAPGKNGADGAPGKNGADGAPGKNGADAKDEGPDEKDLVHAYDKAMKSKVASARASAVTELGDASRTLADKGTSRYVAKALIKALEDEDLEVQAAAVGQLAWGRDVDATIPALGAHVESVREGVEKKITRPDEESKAYVNRATRLSGDASMALANYRDDRSVDLLASTIGKLRPNTDGNNTSTRLVGRLAEALLALGTAEAVSACVRQTQQYSQTDGFQEPAAKELHRVLAIFATKVSKAPPDFTDNFYVDWDNWFEKHGDGFPKKLGKLKEPPAAPPDAGKPGMEEQDDGGAAPR